MRIATSTMSKIMTSAMGNSYNNYANIINKIVSNKNFTKISENPFDANKVLKLKDQLAQLEEYQSNIKAATNEMNLAYDILGAVEDEIGAIDTLVVEAANATTTPEGAKAIAAEIREKVGAIQDKMNTKYMDNYIFSGTYIEQTPYIKNDDGDIIYQGSSQKAGDRKLTIAENKTFAYNFTGEEIFGKQDAGNDFFSEMKDLDNLLNQDTLDYDAIREKLDVLNSTVKNITQAQGGISAKVSKLDSAYETNTDSITKLTGDRADLEEVDIIKAATDLANAQQAMQASYLVGSRVLSNVSLLDYI